jgi:hypothetical protein
VVTHQFLFSFCVSLDEVLPSFWVTGILLRVIKVQALELVVLVEMESFAMSQLQVDLLVFLLKKG